MAATIVMVITRPGKRKVCIVGTYGSVSELVNTADYENKIDIELIQENKDFDETKDLISLASKVQEICSGDADIVIVSARKRFADQIRYFLTYTIDTIRVYMLLRKIITIIRQK
ncbi:MAG: hypothetical protein ACLT33_10740 [Lachnospira pectinoschiza]